MPEQPRLPKEPFRIRRGTWNWRPRGLRYAPPQVAVIALIAAFYGAANGMITIVPGIAVPEMVTREAYGAVKGSLVAPMNIMQALAPLAAAVIWQASGGNGTALAWSSSGH